MLRTYSKRSETSTTVRTFNKTTKSVRPLLEHLLLLLAESNRLFSQRIAFAMEHIVPSAPPTTNHTRFIFIEATHQIINRLTTRRRLTRELDIIRHPLLLQHRIRNFDITRQRIRQPIEHSVYVPNPATKTIFMNHPRQLLEQPVQIRALKTRTLLPDTIANSLVVAKEPHALALPLSTIQTHSDHHA